MLYFLLSTLVLTLYIDVVLSLSIMSCPCHMFMAIYEFGIVICKVAVILHQLQDKFALRWLPQNGTDEKSTLVSVMTWSRQATFHYLDQYWAIPMMPYGHKATISWILLFFKTIKRQVYWLRDIICAYFVSAIHYKDARGPFYWYRLTLIPAWISYYMSNKARVKSLVLEWIKNITLHCIMDVITYLYWK